MTRNIHKCFIVSTLVMSCITNNAAIAKNTLQTTKSIFTVESTDFGRKSMVANKHVFNGFGCSGNNVSPQISWKNVPKGTKSLTMTMYDPDAPTGSGWWHWVVYNIPATATQIPSHILDTTQLPAGSIQGLNDFSTHNYGGPCPPKGDKAHRYIITLHALNIERLDLPENASPALIGFMSNANSIGKATLTVKYKR